MDHLRDQLTETPHRYFILHKPINMVTKFVSPDKVGLLGDLGIDFPSGIHAVGRLDKNSEGLLILTTNKKVTRLLFEGEIPHKRVYLVLVKHKVTSDSLQKLREGISIRVKGGGQYITAPSEVEIVDNPYAYFESRQGIPPYEPFTWLKITLTEGKFRQVRKMVWETGHRCLRLIRISIEELQLNKLKPGEIQEIPETDFFGKLNINI